MLLLYYTHPSRVVGPQGYWQFPSESSQDSRHGTPSRATCEECPCVLVKAVNTSTLTLLCDVTWLTFHEIVVTVSSCSNPWSRAFIQYLKHTERVTGWKHPLRAGIWIRLSSGAQVNFTNRDLDLEDLGGHVHWETPEESSQVPGAAFSDCFKFSGITFTSMQIIFLHRVRFWCFQCE